MPQGVIKLVEFKPAFKNDKGNMVPPKVLDANGTDYAIDRTLVDFISTHVGQALEVEWTEKVNGRWTNRLIASAVEPKVPEKNGGWKRDPQESRHIIRQTCLKASVEMFAALYQGAGKDSGLTTKPILKMAEIFSDWVQRENALPESPVEEVPW